MLKITESHMIDYEKDDSTSFRPIKYDESRFRLHIAEDFTKKPRGANRQMQNGIREMKVNRLKNNFVRKLRKNLANR